MIKQLFKTFILIALVWCVVYFQFHKANHVLATSEINVSPSLVKIDLSKQKGEAELTYNNKTDQNIDISLSALDFRGMDGTVELLTPKDSENYKYSLASWVVFQEKYFSLGPGEIRTVQIVIDAARLGPGGHYASVLAEVKQSDATGNIAIKGVLSSLLFVRAATGNEQETASLKDVNFSTSVWELPSKIGFQFHNSGNVDLTPYGAVMVKDPLGKIVAKGIINHGSLSTLPETIRLYDVGINSEKWIRLPGFYTMELKVKYGHSNSEIKQSYRFFSIGNKYYMVLPVLIIVIAAILCYLKKHNYNQLILSKLKKRK